MRGWVRVKRLDKIKGDMHDQDLLLSSISKYIKHILYNWGDCSIFSQKHVLLLGICSLLTCSLHPSWSFYHLHNGRMCLQYYDDLPRQREVVIANSCRVLHNL